MAMFERSLLLKGPILDFHDYGRKGRYEYTHIWNHEIMFDAYRQDFNSPMHNLYILGPALNLFAFPLLLKVAERRCSQLLKHEIRSGKATKKVGSYRWSEWIDFPCRWGWILDCVMVSKRPGGGGRFGGCFQIFGNMQGKTAEIWAMTSDCRGCFQRLLLPWSLWSEGWFFDMCTL